MQKPLVTVTVLVVVAALLAASPVRAGMFMYDGFDYTAGQTLTSQNGGTGWGGAWATTAENASISTTIVAGLAFSDFAVAGNAVQFFVTVNPNVEFAGRLIGATQTGDIWSSYLYRPDLMTTANAAAFSAIQTSPTQLSGSTSTSMRNISHVSGNTAGKGGTSMTNSETAGTGSGFVNGTTYLLIAKFTNIGPSSAAHIATWWALNAAEFDLLKVGGITETELNTGGNVFSTATDGPTTNITTFTNSPALYVRMQLNDLAAGPYTQTIDELRYGSTLADVTPAVPEPATLALLGLGGLALLVRRRK